MRNMGNQVILKYNTNGEQSFYIIKHIATPFTAQSEHKNAAWIQQNIVTNPNDTWEIMSVRVNSSITKTLLDIAEQVSANCCRKVINQYSESYYVFPLVPNMPMCDHPDARVVDAWCEKNLIGIINCDGVYIRKDEKWQPE